MIISEFKEALGKYALIARWNPTDDQLRQIAEDISKSSELTRDELQRIVASRVGNANFINLEGIDNSDLNTLLQMAKNLARSRNA